MASRDSYPSCNVVVVLLMVFPIPFLFFSVPFILFSLVQVHVLSWSFFMFFCQVFGVVASFIGSCHLHRLLELITRQ